MPQSENEAPDPLSKSQRKKDMHALQNLGKALISLSDSQLAQLPLTPELLELVRFARTLKTHESIRRHLQYIGKHMRHIDATALQKAIENMQLGTKRQTEEFHKVEEWRDLLIAKGDDALQKLMAEYPDIDRQHVRQLIRKAQHDIAQEKNSGAAHELFRYLRELLS